MPCTGSDGAGEASSTGRRRSRRRSHEGFRQRQPTGAMAIGPCGQRVRRWRAAPARAVRRGRVGGRDRHRAAAAGAVHQPSTPDRRRLRDAVVLGDPAATVDGEAVRDERAVRPSPRVRRAPTTSASVGTLRRTPVGRDRGQAPSLRCAGVPPKTCSLGTNVYVPSDPRLVREISAVGGLTKRSTVDLRPGEFGDADVRRSRCPVPAAPAQARLFSSDHRLPRDAGLAMMRFVTATILATAMLLRDNRHGGRRPRGRARPRPARRRADADARRRLPIAAGGRPQPRRRGHELPDRRLARPRAAGHADPCGLGALRAGRAHAEAREARRRCRRG